jgi:hypothetical protein
MATMSVFPVTMGSGSIGNARYSTPSGGLSRHRRYGVCGYSALFPPAPGARVLVRRQKRAAWSSFTGRPRREQNRYDNVTVTGPASTEYPSLLK